MTLWIGITAALAVAALSWHDRRWGISAVLFLLPSYLIRFSIAGIPFTMLEAMILALFVTFMIRDRKTIGDAAQAFFSLPRQRSLRKMPWTAPPVLLVALILISSIYALMATPVLEEGLGIWKAYIVEPILFFTVFLASIRNRRDLMRAWSALIASAAVIAAIALVQYATGWGIPEPWQAWPGRRATGVYGFPNAVGLFLAPALALVIGLAVHLKKTLATRTRIALWLLAGLLLAALAAARVEGALVAAAAATVVLLLFTRWRWWTLLGSLATLAAALAAAPTRAIILFQDTSGDVRLALWRGTWNLLMAQPLFGAGLGAFPVVYDIYRLPSHVELLQYPHNIFLDFWVELGLLGLAWIVAALLTWLLLAWRAYRRGDTLGAVLLGILASVVVYGLVDVPYFKNDLAVLFWTWLGSAFVLARRPARRS
jgi:O-antigen ligase